MPGAKRRSRWVACIATMVVLMLTACRSGDAVELNIDGSSTVFPIAELAVIDYARVDRNVDPTVGFVGTGGGAEKFCRGEIHLWTASRPAREGDLDSGCAAAGVASLDDLVELQVAIDALSIVVNPANDWAKCMTVEQINSAFRAGGAKRWSDIEPGWPDVDIVFYYPGTDSGTYDYFIETVIDEFEGTAHRTDGTSSEDDNVLALGIEQDRNALGYMGYAYYQEASDGIAAVSVDGGNGCIEPTPENALSGEYAPLSRPLYMYSSTSILESTPQAVSFLDFLFANIDIVADAGYIPLPDHVLAEQRAKLNAFDRGVHRDFR